MISAFRVRLASIILLLIALVGVITAFAWAVVAVLADSKSGRAHRVLIAFDQAGNAALGGSEYETISSRAYRAKIAGKIWGVLLCKFLGSISKNHCKNSIGE